MSVIFHAKCFQILCICITFRKWL